LPICQNLLQFAIFFQNIVCVRIENLFPTCQGNVVHTTASLPHFTVPTGARLTRNIAQSSAVGALCVRLHGGVWGGLCPPLSSPGRLYLATFANLVADRTAVCLTQVFALPQCACGNHSTSLPHPTTRPWNIVRHKKHSTQLCSIPPNTKYITLPLKCAAFNPSNNSGQGKGKFQVNRLIQYSNFDTGVSALSSLV